MQVHKVKCNATLQVTMDMTQRDLAPDVLDPEVREVRLSDRLIHSLVLANAPLEVGFGLLSRHVLVVRVTGRDLEGDIGGDENRVVAYRLKEDDDEARLAGYSFDDLLSVMAVGI